MQYTIERLVPGHSMTTRGHSLMNSITQWSFADDMTVTPYDARGGMLALDGLWLSSWVSGHVVAVAANGAKSALSVSNCNAATARRLRRRTWAVRHRAARWRRRAV